MIPVSRVESLGQGSTVPPENGTAKKTGDNFTIATLAGIDQQMDKGIPKQAGIIGLTFLRCHHVVNILTTKQSMFRIDAVVVGTDSEAMPG